MYLYPTSWCCGANSLSTQKAFEKSLERAGTVASTVNENVSDYGGDKLGDDGDYYNDSKDDYD